MISHPHRCISVHIPKTAGNSLNRVFGVGWEDHTDVARYQAELSPEIFQCYFKFAVVRNPWDRLLSDYNYQCRKSRPDITKLHVFDPEGARRKFSAWAVHALTDIDRYPASAWGGRVSAGIHRFSPQLDWITIGGEWGIDYLARLETLDEDFRSISQAVGLESRRLPRRNRRFHFHYSWYYDAETRDLVGRYYAADIKAFGYEFEDRRNRFRWMGWSLRPTQPPPRPPTGVPVAPFERVNALVHTRHAISK